MHEAIIWLVISLAFRMSSLRPMYYASFVCYYFIPLSRFPFSILSWLCFFVHGNWVLKIFVCKSLKWTKKKFHGYLLPMEIFYVDFFNRLKALVKSRKMVASLHFFSNFGSALQFNEFGLDPRSGLRTIIKCSWEDKGPWKCIISSWKSTWTNTGQFCL